jgi:outer membrane protein assembly factor BamB
VGGKAKGTSGRGATRALRRQDRLLNNHLVNSSEYQPMKNTLPFVAALTFAFHLPVVANWPAWRGPLNNGSAPDATPPLEWSETKNVKWKVKLPGSGSATPIVWGDRIFIQAAVKSGQPAEVKPPEPPPAATNAPAGERPRGGRPGRSEAPTDSYKFTVLCLDRKTGQTIWERVAKEAVPHEGHHQDGTFASASPVTDGKVVLAYFGSQGLHCFDLDGKLKWSKDFGLLRIRNSFGEGASAALHGDVVVVNWDHEGDDFIAALDKNTGRELWRTPRDEKTSWGTPLVVDYQGKKQVVVNASTKVRSYDLATGKELWMCGGQTDNAIPCAVADADTVYVTSGFRGAALQAIQLGRTGDLTGTDAVKWNHSKDTPYVPSPVLVNGRIYFLSARGAALSCLDAKTGKPLIEAQRLEGVFNAYASLVATREHVFVLGREGKCAVLKQGDTLEIVATNTLSDRTDATPALVGNELFIRGKEHLYCISRN